MEVIRHKMERKDIEAKPVCQLILQQIRTKSSLSTQFNTKMLLLNPQICSSTPFQGVNHSIASNKHKHESYTPKTNAAASSSFKDSVTLPN